jgi:hypothetical protein
MAKVFSLKSLTAAVQGVAPVLFLLEAAPGTIGKVAAAVVAVLVSVHLLHKDPPK